MGTLPKESSTSDIINSRWRERNSVHDTTNGSLSAHITQSILASQSILALHSSVVSDTAHQKIVRWKSWSNNTDNHKNTIDFLTMNNERNCIYLSHVHVRKSSPAMLLSTTQEFFWQNVKTCYFFGHHLHFDWPSAHMDIIKHRPFLVGYYSKRFSEDVQWPAFIVHIFF